MKNLWRFNSDRKIHLVWDEENTLCGLHVESGANQTSGKVTCKDCLKAISVAQLYATQKPQTQEGWMDTSTLPIHDQDILFVPFPIGSGVRQGCFLEKDEWGRPNMFYGGLGYFEVHKVQYWIPLPHPPTNEQNQFNKTAEKLK